MKQSRKIEIKEMVRRIVAGFDPEQVILFGSHARGNTSPDSDVDVLVEFEPGAVAGLIKLAGMENELGGILGKKVDLRTPQDRSQYFRDEVLKSAGVQYAQA
jgi:hypothetical protein